MVRPQALTGPPGLESRPGELSQPRPAASHVLACPACGAPLTDDQEWCLECGVARTAIQAPPDWRIGVAIMLAVVAIVALVTIIVWP